MNANDIIAHYAMERLQLMLELQEAKQRIAELEKTIRESEE